jgi:hypothetical protein
MSWVRESFAFVLWLLCSNGLFWNGGLFSGVGLLVVLASHSAWWQPPGQSHLMSESSFQHDTVNKCIFQGHRKLFFRCHSRFGSEKAEKPFCLEVWVVCGGTFYRVCMPAQDLLLWNREGEATWGSALEDEVFASTREKKMHGEVVSSGRLYSMQSLVW